MLVGESNSAEVRRICDGGCVYFIEWRVQICDMLQDVDAPVTKTHISRGSPSGSYK